MESLKFDYNKQLIAVTEIALSSFHRNLFLCGQGPFWWF